MHSLSFDDLLKIPSPTTVVNGLLHAGAVGLMYGATASEVNFAALTLARCVATGSAFGDRRVRKGPVLFLTADVPAEADGSGVAFADAGLDEGAETIVKLMRGMFAMPSLVIVDDFERALGGKSVRGTGFAGRVFNPANTVARSTGATVVLLYADKDADATVGEHASLLGTPDSVLRVDGRRITPVKLRDFAPSGDILL